MDGENNGKPYQNGMIWGYPLFFGNTHLGIWDRFSRKSSGFRPLIVLPGFWLVNVRSDHKKCFFLQSCDLARELTIPARGWSSWPSRREAESIHSPQLMKKTEFRPVWSSENKKELFTTRNMRILASIFGHVVDVGWLCSQFTNIFLADRISKQIFVRWDNYRYAKCDDLAAAIWEANTEFPMNKFEKKISLWNIGLYRSWKDYSFVGLVQKSP